MVSIIQGLQENQITDPVSARKYVTAKLTGLIYATRLFFPGLDHLDDQELNKMLFEFFVNTVDSEKFLEPNQSLFQTWDLAGEAYAWYFARVRDYEIIIPTSRDLVTKLPGKKGIVIGANHVPYLITGLKSQEEFQQPPQWRDFINMLPIEYRKAVVDFEKLAKAR